MNFPAKKTRIKHSLLHIQKHLVYNDLIFSMINPSGFSLSHNLDYLQLLIHAEPTAVFNGVQALLSRATSTFTLPDVIHPITHGGSEGDGHTIKHGVLLTQTIFDAIISSDDKILSLFSAIPSSWLRDDSWHLKNYRLYNCVVSLSIKQSPLETLLDISYSKKNSFKFFMINTHYHYKSFVINDTEIAIKSPIIKIPGSETTIRFLKHDDPARL
nr:hypothetical protein DID74_02760 [Candidatus Marinamargulisbacteria bacterium SCGC AG-333-B06]